MGLTDPQSSLLRSMLRLLDGKLRGRFTLTADINLAQVWVAPLGNRDFFNKGGLHKETIWLGSREHFDQTTTRTTALNLNTLGKVNDRLIIHHPISVTEVIEVFNRVSDRLLPERVAAPVAVTTQTILFDALTEAVRGDTATVREVEFAGARKLFIDVARNTVVSQVGHEFLMRAKDFEVTVQAVPATPDRMTTMGTGPIVLALDSLIWDMSHFRVRSGVLSLPQKSRFRLTRWPDAHALQREHYARLAALLSLRTLTIEEVCKATYVDRATVVLFLEAAWACGLATTQEGVKSAPKAASAAAYSSDLAKNQKPFLARIRERLRIW